MSSTVSPEGRHPKVKVSTRKPCHQSMENYCHGLGRKLVEDERYGGKVREASGSWSQNTEPSSSPSVPGVHPW